MKKIRYLSLSAIALLSILVGCAPNSSEGDKTTHDSGTDPTSTPTEVTPSESPTETPTVIPTEAPTVSPTEAPTEVDPFVAPKNISIIGSFESSDWKRDIDFFTTDSGETWHLNNFILLKDQEWKIRQNHLWNGSEGGADWGFDAVSVGKEYVSELKNNIKMSEDGVYNIKFNVKVEKIEIEKTRELEPLLNPYLESGTELLDNDIQSTLDKLLLLYFGDKLPSTTLCEIEHHNFMETYINNSSGETLNYYLEGRSNHAVYDKLNHKSSIELDEYLKEGETAEPEISKTSSYVFYDEAKNGFVSTYSSSYLDEIEKIYTIFDGFDSNVNFNLALKNSELESRAAYLEPNEFFSEILSLWLGYTSSLNLEDIYTNEEKMFKGDNDGDIYFIQRIITSDHLSHEFSFILKNYKITSSYLSEASIMASDNDIFNVKYPNETIEIPAIDLQDYVKVNNSFEVYNTLVTDVTPEAYIKSIIEKMTNATKYDNKNYSIISLRNTIDENGAENSFLKRVYQYETERERARAKSELYIADAEGKLALSSRNEELAINDFENSSAVYYKTINDDAPLKKVINYTESDKQSVMDKAFKKVLSSINFESYKTDYKANQLALLNSIIEEVNDPSCKASLKAKESGSSSRLLTIDDGEYLTQYVFGRDKLNIMYVQKYAGADRFEEIVYLETKSEFVVSLEDKASEYYVSYQ